MEKLLCPSMMCADYGRLAEEIKALDVNQMAPIDALYLVNRLKEKMK